MRYGIFYRLELNRLTAQVLETVLAGCLEKLAQWREQLSPTGRIGACA